MKIAIAQIRAVKGDIDANIVRHESTVQRAAAEKADIICFPELSITGYEPTLARQLATHQEDSRFDRLQDLSDAEHITICIGVPTIAREGVAISMVIFQPHAERRTYSKQQLHADELPYFVRGRQQLVLTVNNTRIAPAICYESLRPDHACNAVKEGAEMYMASVAKPAHGVDKAFRHFPVVAKKYSMPVVMANCLGPCDNFESMGNSAVWNRAGLLAGCLDGTHEGLLLFDAVTEKAGAILL